MVQLTKKSLLQKQRNLSIQVPSLPIWITLGGSVPGLTCCWLNRPDSSQFEDLVKATLQKILVDAASRFDP